MHGVMQWSQLLDTWQVGEDLGGHLDADRAAANDDNTVGGLQPLLLRLHAWAHTSCTALHTCAARDEPFGDGLLLPAVAHVYTIRW